ncbi:hypothetical protein HD554DRAFT_2059935 [Boletus coccyginus]|nr:hypothetical protein HD554DRAFT_2059935 [Boletus coccyginus]
MPELQELIGHTDQLEEYHTNDNPTNPTLVFSPPGASPSSKLPPPEAPLPNPHMDPLVRSEHQSYLCSWHPQDSGTPCHHVADDRPAFLRHLGATHQVSGDPDATIVCWLFDPKTGSACNMPIKRGNYARHADTHYPLRYHCPYCPPGKLTILLPALSLTTISRLYLRVLTFSVHAGSMLLCSLVDWFAETTIPSDLRFILNYGTACNFGTNGTIKMEKWYGCYLPSYKPLVRAIE